MCHLIVAHLELRISLGPASGLFALGLALGVLCAPLRLLLCPLPVHLRMQARNLARVAVA